MKKMLYLLPILGMMLFLFACSEKDDNPTDINVYGYSLDQFVSKAEIATYLEADLDSLELRDLFEYEIVAADGWSPRNSVNAGFDLAWTYLPDLFMVPSDNDRIWHFLPELPSAYKVREAVEMRMYRKFDIADARGAYSQQLGALEAHTIDNWDGNPETAVRLSDLLGGFASYDSLSIICYDGWGEGKYYLPEAVNDGYYLLDSERTIFPTADLPNNQKKMKLVKEIVVYGGVSQENAVELCPREGASVVISFPEDYTGYDGTVMPTEESM